MREVKTILLFKATVLEQILKPRIFTITIMFRHFTCQSRGTQSSQSQHFLIRNTSSIFFSATKWKQVIITHIFSSWGRKRLEVPGKFAFFPVAKVNAFSTIKFSTVNFNFLWAKIHKAFCFQNEMLDYLDVWIALRCPDCNDNLSFDAVKV